MKTKILILTASFSAILAIAQTPSTGLPPTPASPRSTTISPFGRTLSGLTITNSSAQTFSSEEIEPQLVELRSAVDQVLPALTAITEVYSNSSAATQTGVAGGIASVLGGVLDRNTNNAGQPSTNTLSRILREAISAATTNAVGTNFTQLQDFVTLQTNLQATLPIFDRLGISPNAPMPSAIGGSDNNSQTNTGTGKGPGRRDNNNR